MGAILYGRALERLAVEKHKMKLPPNPDRNALHSNSLLGIADYIGQANREHWKWRVNRKIDTYYSLVLAALIVILLIRLQVIR